MWFPNAKGSTLGKKGGRNGLVAVAVDKDKGSQYAIKWAIDNLLAKGQTVILIHVVQKPKAVSYGDNYSTNGLNGAAYREKPVEKHTKELLLPYHIFCTRKDVLCLDVVLEDADIAKAITEYVAHAAIENLVLGASRHGFIRKLKMVDVPGSVSKGAPDFCTVYVISKSKISSVQNASRIAPDFPSNAYEKEHGVKPDAFQTFLRTHLRKDVTYSTTTPRSAETAVLRDQVESLTQQLAERDAFMQKELETERAARAQMEAQIDHERAARAQMEEQMRAEMQAQMSQMTQHVNQLIESMCRQGSFPPQPPPS